MAFGRKIEVAHLGSCHTGMASDPEFPVLFCHVFAYKYSSGKAFGGIRAAAADQRMDEHGYGSHGIDRDRTVWRDRIPAVKMVCGAGYSGYMEQAIS